MQQRKVRDFDDEVRNWAIANKKVHALALQTVFDVEKVFVSGEPARG